MKMQFRYLAGCLLTTLLPGVIGGCGTSRRPPTAGTPPPPHPRTLTQVLRQNQAGPVRLGMSRAEVMALPNLTVSPGEIELEGTKAPVLRISEFGMPVAIAELQDDRVWRIQVYSPDLRTEKGAHVGMTARQLETLYGPGQLLTGEGNVCSRFESEPGISFCFLMKGTGAQRFPSDWDQLLKQNPSVEKIFVTGQ